MVFTTLLVSYKLLNWANSDERLLGEKPAPMFLKVVKRDLQLEDAKRLGSANLNCFLLYLYMELKQFLNLNFWVQKLAGNSRTGDGGFGDFMWQNRCLNFACNSTDFGVKANPRNYPSTFGHLYGL